jgi:hypothetical protein
MATANTLIRLCMGLRINDYHLVQISLSEDTNVVLTAASARVGGFEVLRDKTNLLIISLRADVIAV